MFLDRPNYAGTVGGGLVSVLERLFRSLAQAAIDSYY
jgi:hypothetical protein